MKKKKIGPALEAFLIELEKTTSVLEKFSDEQKSQNQLAVDVKVAFAACATWGTWLEQKKSSETLLSDIKTKEDLIKSSLIREIFALAAAMDRKLESHSVRVSALTKKPLEYYADGKHGITQRKWNEAKNNLLSYRNFALASLEGKGKDEFEVKKPEQDKHLEYLEYVENQLNLLSKQSEVPEGLLSVAPAGPVNPYIQLRIDWRVKYPYKPE